jgi:hypothetical protein
MAPHKLIADYCMKSAKAQTVLYVPVSFGYPWFSSLSHAVINKEDAKTYR